MSPGQMLRRQWANVGWTLVLECQEWRKTVGTFTKDHSDDRPSVQFMQEICEEFDSMPRNNLLLNLKKVFIRGE